jgi:hypothetical protein
VNVDDEDLTIPTDTQGSRLGRRGNRGDTSELSEDGGPDELATVDQKIAAFRAEYPTGRIKTKIETFRDPFGVPTYTVTARVIVAGLTTSKAHATRTRGIGDPYSATFPLETAESVAIGRALRFLGYTATEPVA